MSASATARAWRQRGLTPVVKFVVLTLTGVGGASRGEYCIGFSDFRELTALTECELADELAGPESLGLIVPLDGVDGADGVLTQARYRLACPCDG